MKTIINNNSYEYVINKSRFIGLIYKVNNLEEVNNILKELKNKYKDANHICYAYIVDSNIKCSDDNEPSGTAGIPILEILKKNELNNCLGIVIRYFGGIKLGAGGLIRAYSNTIKNTLIDNIKVLEKGYLIEIKFNYNQESIILNLLENSIILNKNYNENITYLLKVNNDILNKLNNLNIELNIKENIYL